MTTLTRGLIFSVLAAALSLSAGEKPNNKDGGKGPARKGIPEIEFILDHAKDLNLTNDQTRKIKELEAKIEAKREAMMKSPENRELYKELMEARKSGDEAKLKELREQVKEKMAAGGDNVKDELFQILTPDQLQRLKDLRETDGPGKMDRGGGKPGAKGSEGQKPDPNKGIPHLFDNEK